jgi:hypothetical protein
MRTPGSNSTMMSTSLSGLISPQAADLYATELKYLIH